MTPSDLALLATFLRLPPTYTGFDPIANAGDSGMLMDKLLSDGWEIAIVRDGDRYVCRLSRQGQMPVSASSPSRRESLALCALAVCR